MPPHGRHDRQYNTDAIDVDAAEPAQDESPRIVGGTGKADAPLELASSDSEDDDTRAKRRRTDDVEAATGGGHPCGVTDLDCHLRVDAIGSEECFTHCTDQCVPACVTAEAAGMAVGDAAARRSRSSRRRRWGAAAPAQHASARYVAA